MQLNSLRKELEFNTDLLQLVETLKNVAGSQYHMLEKEKERFEIFMESFSSFFRVINMVEVDHPLVRPVSDVLGIVIVTSDSGFMGGLNASVIRNAVETQGDLPDDKVKYIVIGEKGAGPLQDMHKDFHFFPGIGVDTRYEQACEIRDYIVHEVLERRIGRVVLSYPKPLSFTTQQVEVINILPCADLFDQEVSSEVSERVGKMQFLADARKVIVESSLSDMLEYLSSVWVSSRLYEVFEDSKLSEFSARVMHLEGSLQEVDKGQKDIKKKVFKAQHEKIDKGMRESFAAKSGQEKIRKKKKAQENSDAL